MSWPPGPGNREESLRAAHPGPWPCAWGLFGKLPQFRTPSADRQSAIQCPGPDCPLHPSGSRVNRLGLPRPIGLWRRFGLARFGFPTTLELSFLARTTLSGRLLSSDTCLLTSGFRVKGLGFTLSPRLHPISPSLVRVLILKYSAPHQSEAPSHQSKLCKSSGFKIFGAPSVRGSIPSVQA